MVISPERLHPYMTHCLPDQETALELYRWNALASTAYWETLGHLEVALRNTLANRLAKRHRNKQRPGSWLDDRAGELDTNAKADIRKARRRIHEKGNRPGEGQTISELSFGFWRFLLAKQYTNLWGSLSHGFPHAPDRDRHTIEEPVIRLHKFRNRLAHHEPIWNKELTDRCQDIYTLLGYINPDMRQWVSRSCRISATLATCPVQRPCP